MGLDKYDVERLIREAQKHLIVYRFCPVCDARLPMLTWEKTIWSEIRGSSFGKNLRRVVTMFRCPSCLSLWDEYEGKVDEAGK